MSSIHRGVSWYPDPYPSLVRVSGGKGVVQPHADTYQRPGTNSSGRPGCKSWVYVRKSRVTSKGINVASDRQAGIKLNSLHSKEVSHALKKATTDR